MNDIFKIKDTIYVHMYCTFQTQNIIWNKINNKKYVSYRIVVNYRRYDLTVRDDRTIVYSYNLQTDNKVYTKLFQ